MPPLADLASLEEADFSLRSRGTNQLASEPSGVRGYYAVKDRRILLIHGYNVEEPSGQRSMHRLREALVDCCRDLKGRVLTVTWPGSESWIKGGPIAYFRKVSVARAAGQLLAKSVISEYDDGLGVRQLVIIAHSLGCRLALECVSGLDREKRSPKLEKVVIVLMAAAVPTHLEKLFAAARLNADEIFILHSVNDGVLRRWFRLGQTAAHEGTFPEAVGFAGNPRDVPWSDDDPMPGFDHGDYWGSDKTVEVIGRYLSRIFPDILYRPVTLPRTTIRQRSLLPDVGPLSEYVAWR